MDSFISSRKEDPSVKERERALQSLDLSYHKYKETIRHLDEGIQVSLRKGVFSAVFSSGYWVSPVL
jgi:hypothetical protein